MAGALLEITDLPWPVDADRAPLPVTKADVVARLTECGQDHAARIVSRMPVVNGALDPGYVDALGLRVHRELQRLGEELQFGRRVAAVLGPVVAELRRSVGSLVRIVDVGCGLGFVVRSLAATSVRGPDVELVASISTPP
jgi:hypothetical protein